jgi:hypothetical protein
MPSYGFENRPMIRALRPIDETVKDDVLIVDLPPATRGILGGLLLLAAGIATSATLALNNILPSQPPAAVLVYPVLTFCCALFALFKCSGKRIVIDKPNARVLDGSTLFGLTHSAQKTALNGYSGVQISVREEYWIVELTGFDKQKIQLVEFASEDHARAFADRLRLFLQS